MMNIAITDVLIQTCPPRKSVAPRKPYVSLATFSVIKAAKSIHAAFVAVGTSLRDRSVSDDDPSHDEHAISYRARCKALLSTARIIIKSLVKSDLAAYAAQHMSKIVTAAGDGTQPGCMRSLYALTRWLAPWRPHSRLLITDALGNPAEDHAEEARNVRHHFQALGKASYLSMEQHINDVRACFAAEPPMLLASAPSAVAVIGAVDLCARFRRCKPRKACGPLGEPPELYNVAAAELTRLFSPIAIHATASGDIPMQWMGVGHSDDPQGPQEGRQQHDQPQRYRTSGHSAEIDRSGTSSTHGRIGPERDLTSATWQLLRYALMSRSTPPHASPLQRGGGHGALMRGPLR